MRRWPRERGLRPWGTRERDGVGALVEGEQVRSKFWPKGTPRPTSTFWLASWPAAGLAGGGPVDVLVLFGADSREAARLARCRGGLAVPGWRRGRRGRSAASGPPAGPPDGGRDGLRVGRGRGTERSPDSPGLAPGGAASVARRAGLQACRCGRGGRSGRGRGRGWSRTGWTGGRRWHVARRWADPPGRGWARRATFWVWMRCVE